MAPMRPLLLAASLLVSFARAGDDGGFTRSIGDTLREIRSRKIQSQPEPVARPPAGSKAGFDDRRTRVSIAARNMWRDASGRFSGRREGDSLVLFYDFFDDGAQGRYLPCPSKPGNVYPCAEAQKAVVEALELWAAAAGRIVLRRRSGGEAVNIWITWTGALPKLTVGTVVDNAQDVDVKPPEGAASSFGGLSAPVFPELIRTFVTLAFNDAICWYIDDEAACPPPEVLANGKVLRDKSKPLRTVALHEGGHAMGFGHFSGPSIMGASGGEERYELTQYDRDAARLFYEGIARSLDAHNAR
jgi:hypothetical protein